MKLIKFTRTINQEFTGYAVVPNDETPSKVEGDIEEWVDDNLDMNCYEEVTHLSMSRDFDLAVPANRSWFEDEILPNNHGAVIVRNEDGELDDGFTYEWIEELLDKSAADKEYAEFMKKQLVLIG